jgi:hypothetical protein
MAETRLTVTLEGKVSLHEFRLTMVRFDNLLKELCEHIDPESTVHWDILALEAGSATATVEGSSLDRALLLEVKKIYEDIGKRLERGEPLPYPEAIARPATQLTEVINGRVTAVRLRTEDAEAEIVQRILPPEGRGTTYSFGEVRGTVETLQRRRRWRFILYDELFDQKVVCRLRPSQEDMMRQFWGKEVVVTGEIRWDAQSGRPVEVIEVHDIQFLPEVPQGGYERARGVWDMGTDQPEIMLRRLRDGGEG